MKITRSEDAVLGRILLDIEPQEYDGLPLTKQIWIDGKALWSFADHACIAEALFLHSYVSGPLSFSTTCMPFTADALRTLFAPRSVPVTTLSLAPRQPPVGGQTIVIGRIARENRAPGAFTVELGSSARFRTILDMDRAVIASNLRMLLRAGEPEAKMALGLAVLFAGNFDVRRIIVARSDLPMFSAAALSSLQTALRGVNIDLDIRNADAVIERV